MVCRTDVNVLMWALNGRISMLRAIFGDAGGGGGTAPRRRMTAEGFRAFAANHNKRYEAAERRKRSPRGN